MSAAKAVALITGSAQGIGQSIALRLARDGFDVALNDIPSKLDQLRAVASDIGKIGRRTHVVPADVSIEQDVKGMIQSVSEALGGLDVMVANAGVVSASTFVSAELDQWERVFATNARGTFLCYKHAAAQMIAQGRGGRIIGASSLAGKMGFPLGPAYTASKFAVRGLTQSAALELGRYDITVNSYAPGVIATPMTATVFEPGALESLDRESFRWCSDRLGSKPIRRDGEPEVVASIVSYLASDEAYFITGEYRSSFFLRASDGVCLTTI